MLVAEINFFLTEEDEAPLAEVLASSDDEDILLERNTRSPIQEMPDNTPTLQSWVVVRFQVQQRSTKGRVSRNFKFFVGQVSTYILDES